MEPSSLLISFLFFSASFTLFPIVFCLGNPKFISCNYRKHYRRESEFINFFVAYRSVPYRTLPFSANDRLVQPHSVLFCPFSVIYAFKGRALPRFKPGVLNLFHLTEHFGLKKIPTEQDLKKNPSEVV